MANSGSGGVGSKFLSVNLNKSYGRPQSGSSYSSGYGGVGGGSRFRSSGHGGGGGMVVLSRPRSGGAKAGPRLSVPPPLNLPSRRKEHERFDSSASGAPGGAGHGGAGAGVASGGMGWTRPGFLEKDGGAGAGQDDGGAAPLPKAAKSGGGAVAASAMPSVGKAVVLRGEDFPSLQAVLPPTTGSAQKQKDGMKGKNAAVNGVPSSQVERVEKSSPLHMRPQTHSPRLASDDGLSGSGGVSRGASGGLNASEPTRKQDELFLGPLPLVRLSHRSDWADDERDTGSSSLDRERDSKGIRLDADFDVPKPRYPNSYGYNFSDSRGKADGENGKAMLQVDSFGTDVRLPSREDRDGNSWRASVVKDRPRSNEIMEKSSMSSRSFSLSRDNNGRFGDASYGGGSREGYSAAPKTMQDTRYTRSQSASRWADNGRGEEHNSFGVRYFDNSSRFKNDIFQKNPVSKMSSSMGNKGVTIKDPLLNFGKEKRFSLSDSKPYVEEAFGCSDFEKRDFFPGSLLLKKKKDMQKQLEFHDPVRESFEAELERVQQMQERERQRVAEEQARALEVAQKEEEERQRLAREEEDKRRRLEEEARESAWRAEQERLEALKQVEEQRVAREEEKKRIQMEEERRKEAAKQKLLELEARIARRKAESLVDNKSPKRDVERMLDVGEWEDGERMVERITSSTLSDTLGVNRSYESGSGFYNSRDGNTSFLDRGKHVSSWKRDAGSGTGPSFPVHDLENSFHDFRSESSGGERICQRKEFYAAGGMVPLRKTGPSETDNNKYSQLRVQRWNLPVETDHFGKTTDIDSEFTEIQMDRFSDMGWVHGRSRNMAHSSKAERFYQNPEADGFSSFSRPRHSMRQPRVPPPPSLVSIHKNSFRSSNDHSGSPAFLDDDIRVPCMAQSELEGQSAYGNGYQEGQQDYGMRTTSTDERSVLPLHPPGNSSVRCDSQSSHSVSSPPDSPTHLSHDEIDISGEFSEAPAADDIQHSVMTDNNQITSLSEGGSNNLMTASNVASFGEDEEWSIENSQDLQLQEEYDDDGDEYKGVDDVHEDEDENIDLIHECEGIRSEDLSEPCKTDHLVLGFDEGVEVELLSGDEYEKPTSNTEMTTQLRQDSNSFDAALIMDCQSGRGANDASNGSFETSTGLLDETEKSLQALTIESTDTPECLNGLEVATGQLHHSAPQSMASCSTMQPPFSAAIPSSIQSDSPPVQLQFGLFTGPTLFPSPVPAIQIGSIQMPLSLHQQAGPSVAQIHHPHTPSYFQFGQLKYTSPISQGILPSTAQPISLMQSTIQAQYPLNQANGGKLVNQTLQDYSVHDGGLKDNNLLDITGSGLSSCDVSSEQMNKDVNVLQTTENAKIAFPYTHGSAGVSLVNEVKRGPPYPDADSKRRQERPLRNGNKFVGSGGLEGQQLPFLSSEKRIGGSNSGKGKRFVYSVKKSSSGSLLPSPSDNLRLDSSSSLGRSRRNYRTEFRMRENPDKKQLRGLVSSSCTGLDERSGISGKDLGGSIPIMGKKDAFCGKPINLGLESNLVAVSTKPQNAQYEKINRTGGKEGSSKRQFFSDRKISTDNNVVEDIDPTVKSGIVQVFKQPGIEAPSDEDDFIEVRSKRQMLNDRREQREKESKSKSRLTKAPRKPRSALQTSGAISSANRNSIPVSNVVTAVKSSELYAKEAQAPPLPEVPAVTGNLSPPLPPIGTPPVHKDGQSETRSFRSMSQPAVPAPILTAVAPGLSFDAENVVLDKGATALASWASPSISQQLMGFTQTHLDEAMKPSKVTAQVSCVGDRSSMISDSVKPSCSTLLQDNQSFLSGSSPINSLLSGEKIQFGVVTSRAILPSSNCVSNGIKPAGSCRADISIDQNMPASEANSALYFNNNDEQSDKLSLPLNDEEAEAEAAASAVAVAAITNDDVVSNQLSLSSSDTKNYGNTKPEALASEGAVGKHSSLDQQRSERSLPVDLPADLSVETPSLSLWPPLPSPQSNSNALLSRFPGAPTVPFFEMNPMLGGPIYAFGPQDESTGNQSQSQKNSSTTTGPIGAWQQCHSAVDSFYGPPNGFAGPFISAPGGIPGVQGPPHMVVYNHFAPVGQFGQVGLSFMGTTYIPSGKQPDWKHTPISSGMTPSDNDGHKPDTAPDQRHPINIPCSIQHLAPGSPLLPLPSPLALFDMSPFQSTADMSMSARWPQVTAAPIQSVPSSMPLKQPVEGSVPQQFNHGFVVDPTSGKNSQESLTVNPVDGKGKMPTSLGSKQFPDDLVLLDSTSTTNAVVFSSSSRPSSRNSLNNPGNRVPSSNHTDDKITASLGSSSSSSNVSQNVALPVKVAAPSHQTHSVGYSVQRTNGSLQKVSSAGEWHRRVGYQGRNQNVVTDKNFSGSSKVKQIYVAKQSIATGSTSTG